MNNYPGLAEVLVSPLAPVGLIGLMFVLDVYYNLSQRLGEVNRMPPYYRRFLIGSGFVGVALLTQIIRVAAYLSCRPEASFLLSPSFGLIAFHLPLLIGMVVSVLTAWCYWSWLLTGE
ncbi:MAG: hypothetical protein ACPLYD_05820 [Anaerolineae bacterium]|jgi:hypothetical protein